MEIWRYVILSSSLLSLASSPAASPQEEARSGYRIVGDSILFLYLPETPAKDVHVTGNFMDWKRKAQDWRMSFDEGTGSWKLEVPVERVRNAAGRRLGLYEFTFDVDGVMVDADARAPDTIYCGGHGRRYTIPELAR